MAELYRAMALSNSISMCCTVVMSRLQDASHAIWCTGPPFDEIMHKRRS